MVSHWLRGGFTIDHCIISERFWVDLVLRNPLDTEVNLSNLTIVVEEPNGTYTGPIDAFVEVESIDDVVLGARETRTVRFNSDWEFYDIINSA